MISQLRVCAVRIRCDFPVLINVKEFIIAVMSSLSISDPSHARIKATNLMRVVDFASFMLLASCLGQISSELTQLDISTTTFGFPLHCILSLIVKFITPNKFIPN